MKTVRLRKRMATIVLSAVVIATSVCTMPDLVYAWGTKDVIVGRASSIHAPYRHSSRGIEYSYIYFGSYPQSEVTGRELTESIVGADYDEYGDAKVGDSTYRMVEKEGEKHYFRYEPVRWRVVGRVYDEAYLLADTILDCVSYHENILEDEWADSDIRKWLNSRGEEKGFLNTAFEEAEKKELKEYIVQPSDENSSQELKDSIVIPHLEDMGVSALYVSGDAPGIQSSAYAASKLEKSEAELNRWWCGKAYESEGKFYAPYADGEGIIHSEGELTDVRNIGVCPLIKLKLDEEGSWKTEYEVLRDKGLLHYDEEKVGSITSPVQSDSEPGGVLHSYLYMGTYPQSEVTGEALTQAIIDALYDSNGDAVVCGRKYRRTNGKDGMHYYCHEPIRWRVLYINQYSQQALLLAENVLDYHIYGSRREEKCSEIMQWINSFGNEKSSYGESEAGFLKVAFDDEYEGVRTTSIIGENIVKINLLESLDDWFIYGDMKYSQEVLIALQSAYAAEKCVGEKEGTPAKWWLKTEKDRSAFAEYVDKEGNQCTNTLTMDSTGNYMAYANDTSIGVRPSVILDLTKTDAWMTEEEKQKEDRRIMGNVNDDEDVTLEDAKQVLRASLRIEELPKRIKAYADMDGNGMLNLADAQLVLKNALKILK